MWTSGLYVVRGQSMRPAFMPGDQLLTVSRQGSRRGDVVVVRDQRNGEKADLKRVVGLPGERIEQTEGLLLIDGGRLTEPYLQGLPSMVGLEENTWTLADEEYFVLGDNRAHSTDSREFGPVRDEDIVGTALFRYWPLHRLGPVMAPENRSRGS